MALNHIKPHGSLYGMAGAHGGGRPCRLRRRRRVPVPLFGMIGTLHEKVYTARGHGFVAEFYADLDYRDDGGLIITREHDAVDPAEAPRRCRPRHPRRQDAERRRQGRHGPRRRDLRPFRYAERRRQSPSPSAMQ